MNSLHTPIYENKEDTPSKSNKKNDLLLLFHANKRKGDIEKAKPNIKNKSSVQLTADMFNSKSDYFNRFPMSRMPTLKNKQNTKSWMYLSQE